MKQHITHVRNKLSKSSAIIYKASRIIQSSTLVTLYNALFLPYISYFVEIRGNACQSDLQNNIVAQKRIIQVVAKVNRLDHTNDLFTKYSILKFVDLVRLKVALIVNKAKFKTLPPTLQMKFNLNSDIVKPTLRSAGHFKITYVRTSLKQRCISVRGVRIYNALPLNVKSAVNTNILKKRFKRTSLDSYV